MVEFTTDELERHAHTARQQYDDVTEQCWEVCHTFGNILCDHGLPHRQDAYSVEEFRLGPDNGENHFVFLLPGRYAADVAEGETVWVDLSLDQFNDHPAVGEREPFDPVYVMPPGDSRRSRYTDLDAYFEQQFG